ncbi:MAG: 2-C-methyl-D-erythritol 4-phosphate cytidylyltransferase [Ignavibacteriales bacterium]|nr:2-C-methyl-D-erythritol 4-phosphate cytidylyltransferase [Ignavibacteriales bacterium]MBI3787163.1 2-C-methyl-D-erythritol 4-phosphate cytidylyltransferase [Ignavibacteriales bacterium]
MPRTRPKVFVIVPAAGSGTRLGGAVKKQFLLLRDKPILVHTLQRFEHCPDIDEIALAVPEQSIAEIETVLSHYRLHKVSKVTVGGEKRQDSVYNVLKKIPAKLSDIVLVHDGVRPFVEPKRISHLIKTCKEYNAAVLAVQPKDTIRRSAGGDFFDQTLDRNALWLVQTPQAFRAELLLKAYEKAKKEKFYSTDEAALVERIGAKVKIVEGSYDNIKITTQEDLELGKLILDRWRNNGIL